MVCKQCRLASAQSGNSLICQLLRTAERIFWGNISCRVDEQSIAITPSGRGYELLEPEDVVLIDREGAVLEGKQGEQMDEAAEAPAAE